MSARPDHAPTSTPLQRPSSRTLGAANRRLAKLPSLPDTQRGPDDGRPLPPLAQRGAAREQPASESLCERSPTHPPPEIPPRQQNPPQVDPRPFLLEEAPRMIVFVEIDGRGGPPTVRGPTHPRRRARPRVQVAARATWGESDVWHFGAAILWRHDFRA